MPEWLTTAVIVAVIVGICAVAVLSYIKKLSKGCCGTASDKENRIEAADGDYRYFYTVQVTGMTCPKCSLRIENGFNRQKGIKAEADHKSGIVNISSEKELAEILIRKTVIDLGYSISAISENN